MPTLVTSAVIALVVPVGQAVAADDAMASIFPDAYVTFVVALGQYEPEGQAVMPVVACAVEGVIAEPDGTAVATW